MNRVASVPCSSRDSGCAVVFRRRCCMRCQARQAVIGASGCWVLQVLEALERWLGSREAAVEHIVASGIKCWALGGWVGGWVAAAPRCMCACAEHPPVLSGLGCSMQQGAGERELSRPLPGCGVQGWMLRCCRRLGSGRFTGPKRQVVVVLGLLAWSSSCSSDCV